MSPAVEILHSARPHRHFVQLYDGTARLLAKNVGLYLSEGLNHGDAVLVVATPAHTEAFRIELQRHGIDSEEAVREGLLQLLDAEEALSKFMVNGQPNWDLFQDTVGATVREVQTRNTGRGLRAYGEMVGVLWTQGRFSAAMVLEEYWNTVLATTDFRLFCAYPIDVFGKSFHSCDVEALLCSHTHLLPGEANGPLESAIERAMSEVLGAESSQLRARMNTESQPSWAAGLKAEALILWLRSNLTDQADEILGKAQQYYYAAAA